MSFGKKLKAVIKEERYSQKEFAKMVDIPLASLENYLSERQEPTYGVIKKIVNHSQFSKYMAWLMDGDIHPDSGQVCPDFSIQEQCGLVRSASQKQA